MTHAAVPKTSCKYFWLLSLCETTQAKMLAVNHMETCFNMNLKKEGFIQKMRTSEGKAEDGCEYEFGHWSRECPASCPVTRGNTCDLSATLNWKSKRRWMDCLSLNWQYNLQCSLYSALIISIFLRLVLLLTLAMWTLSYEGSMSIVVCC